jgi:hypothetical protein
MGTTVGVNLEPVGAVIDYLLQRRKQKQVEDATRLVAQINELANAPTTQQEQQDLMQGNYDITPKAKRIQDMVQQLLSMPHGTDIYAANAGLISKAEQSANEGAGLQSNLTQLEATLRNSGFGKEVDALGSASPLDKLHSYQQLYDTYLKQFGVAKGQQLATLEAEQTPEAKQLRQEKTQEELAQRKQELQMEQDFKLKTAQLLQAQESNDPKVKQTAATDFMHIVEQRLTNAANSYKQTQNQLARFQTQYSNVKELAQPISGTGVTLPIYAAIKAENPTEYQKLLQLTPEQTQEAEKRIQKLSSKISPTDLTDYGRTQLDLEKTKREYSASAALYNHFSSAYIKDFGEISGLVDPNAKKLSVSAPKTDASQVIEDTYKNNPDTMKATAQASNIVSAVSDLKNYLSAPLSLAANITMKSLGVPEGTKLFDLSSLLATPLSIMHKLSEPSTQTPQTTELKPEDVVDQALAEVSVSPNVYKPEDVIAGIEKKTGTPLSPEAKRAIIVAITTMNKNKHPRR